MSPPPSVSIHIASMQQRILTKYVCITNIKLPVILMCYVYKFSFTSDNISFESGYHQSHIILKIIKKKSYDWVVASIITIYKKGDRTDCGNYRGISLLSIADKIFARILLNRLPTHITPYVVPETHCGFRGNRSTIDIILCLRQLPEKCIEQGRPLYVVFVDFSKAFDTVGRTGLW